METVVGIMCIAAAALNVKLAVDTNEKTRKIIRLVGAALWVVAAYVWLR
jgi:uncharacterized metal-binding protein